MVSTTNVQDVVKDENQYRWFAFDEVRHCRRFFVCPVADVPPEVVAVYQKQQETNDL